MAYCTQADVERHAGGPERLAQLVDYDRDGSADASVITSEIARADAWIDSFARHRYSVPFDAPVPGIISEMSAESAVYNLRKNRLMTTEDDRFLFEARLDWLKSLATGRVTPGIEPLPAKSGAVKSRATDRSSTKRVSRDKLKGFG